MYNLSFLRNNKISSSSSKRPSVLLPFWPVCSKLFVTIQDIVNYTTLSVAKFPSHLMRKFSRWTAGRNCMFALGLLFAAI